jgi:hypothetical protein
MHLRSAPSIKGSKTCGTQPTPWPEQLEGDKTDTRVKEHTSKDRNDVPHQNLRVNRFLVPLAI